MALRHRRWLNVETPRESQEQHAIRRATERYGLALSRSDLRYIGWSVHCGCGRYVCTQDATRSVYEIDREGKSLMLVYDPTRRCIKTFLPERASRTDEQYLGWIRNFFEWEGE